MLTTCLPNLHVSMATRCQYHGGSQMNKFEQVSSDHHQMLLVGGPRSDIQGRGQGPKFCCPGDPTCLSSGVPHLAVYEQLCQKVA